MNIRWDMSSSQANAKPGRREGCSARNAAANAESTWGWMGSRVGSGALSSKRKEPKRRRYARWLKSCGLLS